MSETIHTENSTTAPNIRSIASDAPWAWLAAGWRDLWNSPLFSLIYGAGFALAALVMFLALQNMGSAGLIPIMGGGFLLLGPLLAAGLYEKSRVIEKGGRLSLAAIISVGVRSPVGLAYMGVMLLVVFIFWIPIAMVLFALFLGHIGLPPLDQFVQQLLFTPNGLALLVVGTAVGALLAGITYTLSVISVPMLLDRDVDIFTAVATSIRAVRANFSPMLLWATIIAVLMAVGMATAFVGLIITFPLVGHATWHAYRAIVEE